MTLRLMLLRHAKSSWLDPGTDDKERPLSPRGLKAAPAIGRYMRKTGYSPELVLCSDARRARETWRLVADELKAGPKIMIDGAIYDFGNGGQVMDTIRTRAKNERCVLVVGHNPSIGLLALQLTGSGDAKLRKQMGTKFPTGALAVVDFEIENWSDLGTVRGTLFDFTRPKDLGVSE